MAVQAQYPSNVLLLNRSGQERRDMLAGDFPLQAQTNGFLDQSAIFLNAAEDTNNPRKRGREMATQFSPTPVNLFALLPQQPSPPTTQLVDLAQLHNNQQQQPCLVSTGLRLSFHDQQHLNQTQQQENQNSCLSNPSSLPASTSTSSLLSEDIASLIKIQRDEIDQFLQAQGDQLRRTLAERRHRHYRTLLGAAQESAARRLRQKEAEAEKAARRSAELEERVAQLRAEAQAWQARARAQEAAAAALQAQLQQAMMREEAAGGETAATAAEDAESGNVDTGREAVAGPPPCRACRRRAACVVALPCRHLGLCAECDSVVGPCPICHSVRSASVHVYLS